MRSTQFSKRSVLAEEASEAVFADARLTGRYQTMLLSAAASPSSPFPEMFGTSAELEGGYRFFSNHKTDWLKMLEPHFSGTAKRALRQETVVIPHDTTEFKFSGEVYREGLGYLRHGESQGFFGHFGLLWSMELGLPLGIGHAEALIRDFSKRGIKRKAAEVRDDPQKESLRWHRGVDAVEARKPEGVQYIHVMDREADDYELLAHLFNTGASFVIRSNTNRVLKQDRVHDFARKHPGRFYGEIPLSKRRRNTFENNRKKLPERESRLATLYASAVTVTLQRPGVAKRSLPKTLSLNCVRVYETNPPKGESAVEWFLYTNLPIATAADLYKTIQAYVTRWKIEEFFKALKTGCAYEDRQLETASGLLKALALLTPIAWHLMALKELAKVAPEIPALKVVSKLRIELLRRLSDYKMPVEPTITDILLATARMGGHLKQNGPPGWMTLGRGMIKLADAERTVRAMKDVIND